MNQEKLNPFQNENMKYEILTNRPNTSTINSSQKKQKKNKKHFKKIGLDV
jgi:hypothetical protein